VPESLVRVPGLDSGFHVVFRGESYWLELDVATMRVTLDLQHHGLMGQPGEVERVGEGVWANERITGRSGVLAKEAFDAAEAALRAHIEEARAAN
jgi:hypothetical protein